MQKIFIRYFLIIMVVTVVVTLFGNSVVQMHSAQHAAQVTGKKIMGEISSRIENNNETIKNLVDSLSENYITRASALAEMIAQSPEIVNSFDEMQRLAKVLHVDEVHVTDEQGVLRWGSVPAYYGLDFATTDQTRPFLPALSDKRFAMAQAPQPNGMEGKLFQYIGVARQDKPGIVQVGVVPTVLDRALDNNRIHDIVANFNVAEGEKVLAIDKRTGIVVADSDRRFVGKNYKTVGIQQNLSGLATTYGWIEVMGQPVYAVFGAYGQYILGVGFTENQLRAEHKGHNMVVIASNILLGLAILITLFILLKQIIIKDIISVNSCLQRITEGDLDVVVTAKATPELAVLSRGINEMVSSLKSHIAEIALQGAELEESHQNILSSLSYARRIQNNLLPDPRVFRAAFSDMCVLWEPKDTVGGDMYWVKPFDDGVVLCVCDCTGHGTPGALLTMLVATALETIVTRRNCDKPAEIMWELEQKLIATLNATDSDADIRDGADLAILYVAQNGEITLASANIHVFVCNGETVETVRGQKLSIGEGYLADKDAIQTVVIPADPRNSYYVASDGIFDQIGGKNGIPFGYRRFKRIILEHHALGQEAVTQALWTAFTTYMGTESRRDDITLMGFKP